MKLHKWAEKAFSLKCSEGDAIATRPDEDENGWDFLVEFPAKPFDGPAESRPPTQTAFVQVKSTRGAAPIAPIKLSNMLKACRSRDPWFVVMIVADRAGKNPKYYGRHIWEEVMYDALKAVRAADLAGVKLHHRVFSLDFSDDDQLPADVVSWMQRCIDDIGSDYGASKAQLSDNVGFEDGCGDGNFSFDAVPLKDLVDAFLGFDKELRGSSLTYTPRRFGLTDTVPQVDGKTGVFRITKEPVESCQIVIRGPTQEPSISLDGHIYAMAFPGGLGQWLRFSAPPLEMVLELAKAGTATIDLVPDQPFELRHLRDILTVLVWASERVLDVQVFADGTRMTGSTIDLRREQNPTHLALVKVLRLLCSLHRATKPHIKISAQEVFRWLPELEPFAVIVTEPTFMLTFEDHSDLPSAPSSLVYYIETRVSEWIFRCIVLRPVQRDEQQGDMREIVLGPGKIIESEVSGLAGYNEEDFESRYGRIADEVGTDEAVLNLGNIRKQFARAEEEMRHESVPGIEA